MLQNNCRSQHQCASDNISAQHQCTLPQSITVRIRQHQCATHQCASENISAHCRSQKQCTLLFVNLGACLLACNASYGKGTVHSTLQCGFNSSLQCDFVSTLQCSHAAVYPPYLQCEFISSLQCDLVSAYSARTLQCIDPTCSVIYF